MAALAGAALLLTTQPSDAGQARGLAIRPVAWLRAGAQGWAGGELANATLTSEGLRLADDAAIARDGRSGYYVSPVEVTDEPFDQVRARVESDAVVDGAVALDVRSSADGERWSTWVPAPDDGSAAVMPPGRFVQYRAELTAGQNGSPLLRELGLELASNGVAPSDASGDNPTVRLFATREGLVGRKTANGHTITERDRFVALPSKKVLNPLDKRDYQVRLSYKGKTTTAPVWDVGPWNTKDNFWDDQRELFGDLPRFVPQAYAAWRNEYNGGRDQYNRWVSFPASIDLGDGIFIDDLGLRNSDWVDVTFLWVNAPSPASLETPAVTGLKPEPKAAPPAPQGQSWFFAEGITRAPFETWFTLFNPGSETARATLTFSRVEGGLQREEVVLEPSARVAVNANKVLPDAEFVTRIDSTQPILAERSTYFGFDGHSSTGTAAPSTTWYLADGSAQAPFDTWILIQNPGATPASVNLIFMKDNGENRTTTLTVPPVSRREVRATDVMPDQGFATKVVSDQPVVVERTVYLAGGGGHSATAVTAPARTWYLAEGSTIDRFDTWIVIQNPNRAPATVMLSFLREQGPPLTQQVVVAPTGRLAYNARLVVPGERFGLRIDADQPIVAERTMYFGGESDGDGTGAHASAGSTDLDTTWYLLDGSPRSPYQEQILVANPGSASARLKIEFLRGDGTSTTRELDVPAQRRLTVDVNATVPDPAVVTKVTSDKPVVVERSTYFNGGSGGTNSLGRRL